MPCHRIRAETARVASGRPSTAVRRQAASRVTRAADAGDERCPLRRMQRDAEPRACRRARAGSSGSGRRPGRTARRRRPCRSRPGRARRCAAGSGAARRRCCAPRRRRRPARPSGLVAPEDGQRVEDVAEHPGVGQHRIGRRAGRSRCRRGSRRCSRAATRAGIRRDGRRRLEAGQRAQAARQRGQRVEVDQPL